MSAARLPWLVAALMASIATGYAASKSWRASPPIQFEPSSIKFLESVPEYSLARVPFAIRNPSASRPVDVELSLSCGCMRLVGEAGEISMNAPIRIAPSTAIALETDVMTANHAGPMSAAVYAREAGAAGRNPLAMNVTITVAPGMRVSPNLVELTNSRDDEQTALVDVYDGYPGSGMDIQHIEVSNPAAITVQILRVAAGEISQKPAARVPPNCDIQHRATIRLTARVGQGAMEKGEWMTIYPTATGHDPVRVEIVPPVVMREVVFQPSEVVATRQAILADGANAARRVRLRFANAGADPRIARCPSFARATLQPIDDREYDLQIEFEPLAALTATGEILIEYSVDQELREASVRVAIVDETAGEPSARDDGEQPPVTQ